jgi:hypothetical protein
MEAIVAHDWCHCDDAVCRCGDDSYGRDPGLSRDEALRSGDQRVALEALRDQLVDGVLAATDRRLIHLAPLAKAYLDVLGKIEALPALKADSVDDSRSSTAAKLRAVR